MNFRPSAQLREMHDDLRCPADCPLCLQVEAAEVEPREGRDYLVTSDYPEPA